MAKAHLPRAAGRPTYHWAGELQFCREDTYHAKQVVARNPSRASGRARRDAELKDKIQEVWPDNRKLYGARKIWHALKRVGVRVARVRHGLKPVAALRRCPIRLS